MLCNKDHEELPSRSTSGGQSAGSCRDEVADAGGEIVEVAEGELVFCLAIAIHEATEVQLLHL